MTREEFTDRVVKLRGKIFNIEQDYPLIEFVYTWHPLISETEGKDQVAYLYKTFGIGIFKEMKPKAEKAKDLDEKIRLETAVLNELATELEELKGGN